MDKLALFWVVLFLAPSEVAVIAELFDSFVLFETIRIVSFWASSKSVRKVVPYQKFAFEILQSRSIISSLSFVCYTMFTIQ